VTFLGRYGQKLASVVDERTSEPQGEADDVLHLSWSMYDSEPACFGARLRPSIWRALGLLALLQPVAAQRALESSKRGKILGQSLHHGIATRGGAELVASHAWADGCEAARICVATRAPSSFPFLGNMDLRPRSLSFSDASAVPYRWPSYPWGSSGSISWMEFVLSKVSDTDPLPHPINNFIPSEEHWLSLKQKLCTCPVAEFSNLQPVLWAAMIDATRPAWLAASWGPLLQSVSLIPFPVFAGLGCVMPDSSGSGLPCFLFRIANKGALEQVLFPSDCCPLPESVEHSPAHRPSD